MIRFIPGGTAVFTSATPAIVSLGHRFIRPAQFRPILTQDVLCSLVCLGRHESFDCLRCLAKLFCRVANAMSLEE